MAEIYQRTNDATDGDSGKTKAYLVGGGIASLASAAYLLRDGHIPGENIHILEESDQIGGSMGAHGSPETGYIMRGGRMFDEEAYTCTYDLLSFIPSLSDPNKTVKEEMFEFNKKITSSSKSRLVKNGKKVDVSGHCGKHLQKSSLTLADHPFSMIIGMNQNGNRLPLHFEIRPSST